MKTVLCECPKCKEVNCMNIFGKDIYEVDVEWFMCSFCRKPSGKAEWKELPQAIKATEQPSKAVAESEVYGNDCHKGQC